MERILNRLKNSKFRSSFHLNKKMKEYVNNKGMDVIRRHAYDFVNQRLKIYDKNKDGKQTPLRQGHPVFTSQHATATCCRGCIEKWHHIPKEKTLNDIEIDYIVNIMIEWIEKEYQK